MSLTPSSLSLSELSHYDLVRLSSIIENTVDTTLKERLRQNFTPFCAKKVTSLYNEYYNRDVQPQETKQSNQEDLSIKEPTEKDEIDYMISQIKGLDRKTKSLKVSVSNLSTRKIQEALVRCKGSEDDAVMALITGELPKMPKVPASFYVEFRRKQEQRIIRRKIEIAKEDEKRTKEKKKVFEEIKDLDYEECEIDELNKRKEKLERLVEELGEDINGLEGNNIMDVGLRAMNETLYKSNKWHQSLYVPGEVSCLESNTFKIFNLEQERHFSYEVKQYHFRVAESEFYRLRGYDFSYRVNKIQYIVNPEIRMKFETKRQNIACEHGTTYDRVKPILTYIDPEKQDIESISRENYKVNSDGMIYCSNNPNISISRDGKLIIALVIPGKAFLSDQKNFTKRKKYDCVMSKDGLSCCVWDIDQVQPYYIVHYTSQKMTLQSYSNTYSGTERTSVKHLEEEWEDISKNAEADKTMNDVRKNYLESLAKAEKERKLDKEYGSSLAAEMYQAEIQRADPRFIVGVDYSDEEMSFSSSINDEGSLSNIDCTPTPLTDMDDSIFEDV